LVQAVAAEVEPFDIHIAGLKRTWDHWMCLGLEEGYDEIITLHDQLYSGSLEKYLRTDLPFEPHIALGFFGMGPYDPLNPESLEFDSEGFEDARREVADLGIDARRRVETLTVVRLTTGLDTFEDVAAIRLGS
jgi:2'-5' RNA ligase